MIARAGLIGAGLLAVAYMLHRQAQAQAEAAAADDGATDAGSLLDYVDPWGALERQVEQYQTDTDMQSSNVRAFLDMIAAAEGTAGRGDYRACYGYRHTIQSFADHPAITGEWSGEPLDNLGPRYAGLKSTAAGRYQTIRATWLDAKRALSLPDFGPESQDRAAVWLVRQCGALADVQAGRIEAAVAKCSSKWASLPGSTAGQGTRQMGTLLAAYRAAGGVTA